MSARLRSTWLLLATGGALACSEGAESPAAAPPAEAEEPAPISGLYEVSGTTVDSASGAERGISGKLILHAVDDGYTATFHLATSIRNQGQTQQAEVIGKGEGRVEGRTLTGKAQTQLVVALVPGVDAGFGMLPRSITTRIVNTSTASIGNDGSVEIQIASEAAPGEENYQPTRTTLRGRRIGAIGLGGDE